VEIGNTISSIFGTQKVWHLSDEDGRRVIADLQDELSTVHGKLAGLIYGYTRTKNASGLPYEMITRIYTMIDGKRYALTSVFNLQCVDEV
jgi:hypothetical protein